MYACVYVCKLDGGVQALPFGYGKKGKFTNKSASLTSLTNKRYTKLITNIYTPPPDLEGRAGAVRLRDRPMISSSLAFTCPPRPRTL